MTTARQIMTALPEFVRPHHTVTEAARRMAVLGVGALPICGADDRLLGIITDRDIAVKIVAHGRDPKATWSGDLAQGQLITIGPDEPVDRAPAIMATNQVSRLPVVDGERLVGIIARCDLARAMPELAAGDLLAALPVS
jgi:CBS domain-containing protein